MDTRTILMETAGGGGGGGGSGKPSGGQQKSRTDTKVKSTKKVRGKKR